ncbi:hypothetical protein, partial [Nocardioides psychrotolerans]|uniref:hypothetical protein n=1 Tax=Nocardioides psychrotolerans TaxID=1005945 RepID=UPI001C3F6145
MLRVIEPLEHLGARIVLVVVGLDRCQTLQVRLADGPESDLAALQAETEQRPVHRQALVRATGHGVIVP